MTTLRLALLFVLAVSAGAQIDESSRLLTSIRQPVVVEASLPNITVGFKTGPNIPDTEFTIKCVLEGEGCGAPGWGQSVSGLLPVTPAVVEGTVQGLDVEQTYSCYVETYLIKEKISYCREAKPLPGTVKVELIFPAYASAAAFGQPEKDQICANLLSLQLEGQCSVVRVMDGNVRVFIQMEADDYRDAWSLGAMLKQGGSEVDDVLLRGLEGPVEIVNVVAEPPFPTSATAATIVAATPKAGSENNTLVVNWTAGEDSVPPAGDPAFYVACLVSGSACPSSPTFDMNRPLGLDESTDVVGLMEGTLYDCFVVAKDWDGSGVCSDPVQVSTYQRAAAPMIASVEPKVGAETDTLVVTWMPGDDSVPPAGDPAFYVACLVSGSACPSSPTFDMNRPLGLDESTDVVGLMEGTLYDCFVVAKDWDGSGVCSDPVQVSTYQRAAAPMIASVEPKVGAETDTLVVTWMPGDDSVPPAGDPAFYVACLVSGSACPSSPTFDMNRPLGLDESTDVVGLMEGTLYDCFVVAKDWDGSGVCSDPVSTITLCDVSLNYEASPVNGMCVCMPGFRDLNGDPADGCEYEQTCTIGDGNPVFYQDCDYQSSTWEPFCLTEGTYDVSTRVADMSSMEIADGYRVSFKYNPGSQTCNAYSLPGGTSSIPCFTSVACYGPQGVSVRNINDAVVQVTVIKYT